MARTYTITLLLFLTCLFGKAQSVCTPDPAHANNNTGGYFNIQLGYAFYNQPYHHVIDVVTIEWLSAFPSALPVGASRVCYFEGLPPGFTITFNYNDTVGGLPCWANNGTYPNWTRVQGCFSIDATAQAVNDALGILDSVAFTYSVASDDYYCDNTMPPNCQWGSDNNQPCSASIAFQGILRIVRDSSFVNVIEHKISVGEPYPNPASSQVVIPISTLTPQRVTINLYNITGILVKQAVIDCNTGQTNYNLNISALSPGLYNYTISDGKHINTKKLVIQ